MINNVLLFGLEKLLDFLRDEVHLRRAGEKAAPRPMPTRQPMLNISFPTSSKKAVAKVARASGRSRRPNPIPFLMLAAGVFVAWSLIRRNRDTLRGWIEQANSADEE